jgi:hypothetical protein
MNFDLNIDNYSKSDYLDIFNLDKLINPTPDIIETKYQDLLNNIHGENIPMDNKNDITSFLTRCKNNLIVILNKNKNDYKLIDSDFIPTLYHSDTFQNNSNFVIKKQENPDESHTNKINPLATIKRNQLLNINTKFRKNYYNTNASDFVIDLPEEYKNVTSLTLQGIQIPNSVYNFSSKLGTNEFTVELFDIDSNGVIDGSQQKKTIKIQNGIYTGFMLEDYLNTFVFNDVSLNRITTKFDEISRKFRFVRDYRKVKNGGLPFNGITHAFNIDWRLSEDKTRPIQLNMGWILGYRQQYYEWNNDYTTTEKVSFDKYEGYNPEALYDSLGSTYFILSLDDFNKNYANTISSPFQESVFNDPNAIAKVKSDNGSLNFENMGYESKRTYFGPVNIKKLHIKLLDDMGRVVDLNNRDFSFGIEIEQLYDVHANKNIH